jgi:hypothetical protein
LDVAKNHHQPIAAFAKTDGLPLIGLFQFLAKLCREHFRQRLHRIHLSRQRAHREAVPIASSMILSLLVTAFRWVRGRIQTSSA